MFFQIQNQDPLSTLRTSHIYIFVLFFYYSIVGIELCIIHNSKQSQFFLSFKFYFKENHFQYKLLFNILFLIHECLNFSINFIAMLDSLFDKVFLRWAEAINPTIFTKKFGSKIRHVSIILYIQAFLKLYPGFLCITSKLPVQFWTKK